MTDALSGAVGIGTVARKIPACATLLDGREVIAIEIDGSATFNWREVRRLAAEHLGACQSHEPEKTSLIGGLCLVAWAAANPGVAP